MVCHYCGQERLPVTTCPQCNSVDVGYGSFGTEMVEQEVKTFFPDARIERLDTDVAKKKDHVATVLTQFQSGEIDILLGTQMVAKGLNFPKVDLVGIVLADSGLNLPDFRSQERTFSLITQVSGRSGRFSTEGKVIVQTFHPDNPAIKLATEAKGDEFYTQELQMRKATLFPPFSRLVNFVIRGRNQQKCKEAIESLRKVISASIEALERENLPKSTLPTLLGASLCPIEKIAGNWRYHLLLRGENPALVLRIANYVYTNFKLSGQLYIEIDVDPLSLL